MNILSDRTDIVEDLDEETNPGELQPKRARIEEKIEILPDKKLDAFLNWCKERGVFIDYEKVKITNHGTSDNYGMVAIKDIQKDEILSRIPKAAILNPYTTKIKDLIQENSTKLKSKSNWSKLIASIMFELNNPNSLWKEYLECFPNYDYFDLPMFWESNQVKLLLENTCIPKNVMIDIENMKNEYQNIILPFLEKYKQHFNEKCFTFEFYKKIVGFIMAYSFRDPNEDPDNPKAIGPMMVPVADILNHIAKNNAQIRFEKDQLLIVSITEIKQGEEVYNTYGEHSNSDLLHMYGFVELYPHNIFDSVEIPTKCFIEAFRKEKIDPIEVANKKIETLIEIELIDRSASIIIGHDGILNEEECLHIFQIYSMPVDDFSEFLENNCELLSDEEWDDYSLMNDKIHKIPIDWKDLIRDSCQLHTDDLKSSLEKLNSFKLDDDGDKNTKIKNEQRVKLAKTLIDGQLKLIHNFITCLDL